MEVLIRQYESTDFEQMLSVTMELWNLKMHPYTKQNLEKNTGIIRDTESIPSAYNDGIYIAEVEGKIAGVIHIDFKEKKSTEAHSMSVIKLIFKYGLIRLLKVRKMGVQFKHVIADDELHIHGIVVSSNYRGLGIGSKLIKKAEEIASLKHKHKLTLEVLDTNILAFKLYQTLGFKVIKKVHFSRKQQKSFNSKYHIYMQKDK